MELGLEFDDDDLVQERKPKQPLTSYNARICSPKWFLEDSADTEDTDKATLYKFRGDHHYRQGLYQKAIDCYNISLGSLRNQNRTMRREITESMSRCFLNTGNTNQAFHLADKVMEDCLTRDQMCHGLILKQLIHQKSGNIPEEIQILYQLIHLHPRNVQFWTSLKNVYERIQTERDNQVINQLDTHNGASQNLLVKKTTQNSKENIKSCGSKTEKIEPYSSNIDQIIVTESSVEESLRDINISECRTNNVTSGNRITGLCSSAKCASLNDSSGCNKQVNKYEDILTGLSCQLLILTCCVRIRLILQSVQGTIASFIKEKNQHLQNKIDEDICSLAVEEGVLCKVTEFMKKDIFEDDYGESKTGGDEEDKEMPTFTAEEFNRRWFSWITDT